MTDAQILVSLLFLSVAVTLAGFVVSLWKLCNFKDEQVSENYAERRRRQEFDNRN